MTIVQELEQANKSIAGLTAANVDAARSVVAITAERDAAKQAHADAIAAHEKAIVEVNAAAKKASDDLAAECVAHGATKQQLEKAQHALANPAFADAAVRGETKPTAEGGAAPANPPMTLAQAMAEYNKITDAVARAQYRNEHKKELGIA